MSDEANASTETSDATAQATTTEGLTTEQGPTPGETGTTQEQGQKEGDQKSNDSGDAEPFALKAPEGAEAFQADFDKFAGDMDGWLKANPNATAREALAEAANRQARTAGEGQRAALAAHNKQISDWEAGLKADPDFGGENFDANVATFLKGVDAVGSPELRQMLDQSGMGSHPEIVKAFHKVGKMVADSSVATGKAGTESRSNFATSLYGSNGKG